ncbi:uncharacterized protein [Littorina saxatilis]|uniref:uncharacterized protein isoform X3 n=1 Tax=Littorina saxatilis TaxID=31220 RepID=UPI0038B66355
MNTEHGLLSVALLTVTLVFVLAFNFLFVLVESSECLDSEQNHGDSNVYIPANCRPTECAVTGAYNHSTKYLQCSIKNYANHFPNACDKIKEEISSQSLEPGEHHAFQEACQATLASISLFMFHCQPLTPEVSLNFTFHFPLCGEDNTPSASAVMVEFSAGKESIDNYFARNHICRVFDFSGSSFSQLTHDDQIQLSYDCIAIGLRDSVSVHLEYYYYLSFSTFSAGDILNYTLVYQDVSSSSMQLVAAAWRSTSRVHVVFQPISGVNKYAVAAGCLQRNIFAQVISSPTVEISDIPPECSVVSVSVKPHAPECQKKGLTCSSIKVTLLDKTGLQLPEESRQTQEYGWLWSGRMIVSVVIVSLIIVSILVAVVLYRHKKKHAVKKRQASMPCPRQEAQPTSLDHQSLDFRAQWGSFLSIYAGLMYRRAGTKLATGVHVLSCRTWGTGVMEGQPSPTRNPFPPPATGHPTNKRPARPPPPPPSLSPLSPPLKDIGPKQTAQKPPETIVQVPYTLHKCLAHPLPCALPLVLAGL